MAIQLSKDTITVEKNNRSRREKAYYHIQQMISSGELRAGDSVSEVLFANRLGISRTPIREAIGQLVAEGLLDQKPNRGAVVSQITRQDIIDLYELREALEIYAVRKVASQPINVNHLNRLQSSVDEILQLRDELIKTGRATLDYKQMQQFVSCDISFHALLMHLAGNLRILKVVSETRLLIKIFAIKRSGHTIAELENIHRYHQDILQAISNQNTELVTSLLAEHIQISMQERLDEFDDWEGENSLRESISAFF